MQVEIYTPPNIYKTIIYIKQSTNQTGKSNIGNQIIQ